MKNLILLIAVLTSSYGYGQTETSVVPKPSRDLEIALIPFGMENPINTGALKKSGNATLNDNVSFKHVSKSQQDDYVLKMSEVLVFCDNFNELLTTGENIDAFETGPFFLMDQGQIVGFVSLVTNNELFSWIIDEENNNPAVGSYFELVYVESGFNFSGNCIQTNDNDEEETQTQFDLNLNLKPGLNYLEYNIQSINQSNSQGGIPFPERVSVTAHQKLPDNVIWMAHYY